MRGNDTSEIEQKYIFYLSISSYGFTTGYHFSDTANSYTNSVLDILSGVV